jgi:hypothetical protein
LLDISNRGVYSSMIFDFFSTHLFFSDLSDPRSFDSVERTYTLSGPGINCWSFHWETELHSKNAQLVSSLQTSCHKSVHKLLQVCSQAVNKFSLHCLLPVVATSLEQAVNCNF